MYEYSLIFYLWYPSIKNSANKFNPLLSWNYINHNYISIHLLSSIYKTNSSLLTTLFSTFFSYVNFHFRLNIILLFISKCICNSHMLLSYILVRCYDDCFSMMMTFKASKDLWIPEIFCSLRFWEYYSAIQKYYRDEDYGRNLNYLQNCDGKLHIICIETLHCSQKSNQGLGYSNQHKMHLCQNSPIFEVWNSNLLPN
jgi:hypothetical protein